MQDTEGYYQPTEADWEAWFAYVESCDHERVPDCDVDSCPVCHREEVSRQESMRLFNMECNTVVPDGAPW